MGGQRVALQWPLLFPIPAGRHEQRGVLVLVLSSAPNQPHRMMRVFLPACSQVEHAISRRLPRGPSSFQGNICRHPLGFFFLGHPLPVAVCSPSSFPIFAVPCRSIVVRPIHGCFYLGFPLRTPAC